MSTQAEATVTDASGNEPDPAAAKEQAEAFRKVIANLGPSLKTFTQSLLNLGAPKDEVEAKLQELEANNSEFQGLSAALQQFNDQKEQFAQELNLALQEISTARNTIINSLLATDELFQQREATLTLLGHQALLFARQMGREAQRRLNKFQYFLIKSYEYRVVQPFPTVNFDLDDVFTQFETQLSASTDGSLTQDQISELVTGVYTANLQTITSKLFQDFENEVVNEESNFDINVSSEDLAQFNQTNSLVINFQALQQIDPKHENVRISDLKVSALEVDRTGPPFTDENLVITLTHLTG